MSDATPPTSADVPASDRAATLVILGASGDLTRRLLLPGIGSLLAQEPDREVRVIGADRGERPDGDFDAAAHLIAARSIAAMDLDSERTAPAGAEWRQRKSAGGVVRVLWSKRYDFPLAIESESGAGTKRDAISVTLEPAPAESELPWASIGNYEKKTDMDYMD